MGRISKELSYKRIGAINELIVKGINEVNEIAKALQDHPDFDGKFINIYQFVRNNLHNENKPSLMARHKNSKFDELLNSVKLYLNIETARMVDNRLIKPLRNLFLELEDQVSQIPAMQNKISNFENHLRPDANKELKKMNQELKDKVAFLEKRVEALSNMTKTQVRSHHMAVSGD